MDNSNQFVLADHKQATIDLTNEIKNKLDYLQSLGRAVQAQDDRLVYQLIDSEKYSTEILKARHSSYDKSNERLVEDAYCLVSEYLSSNLIGFLRERYPFFYFEETETGKFQFYFGNWWGRRLFGTLDVLNVKFNFDENEYQKLARSFEFEAENKRLNTDTIERLSQENDELQELLDSQSNREAEKERMRKKLKQLNQEKVMPWDAGKQREMKQRLTDELSRIAEIDEKAANGYQRIHENEKRVLELSKEDTLLGYEKQSIIAKFGSFENFKEKNAALYRDYITDLIATGNRRN
ncbi:exonuclease SbcC [Ligilactobacillus ruminis]|jgi:hypothetical protein|uniref:exonuclease SbcC n=1 Tax=Ligilactobacillus ruminis TaxID=1623 RepID=UPI0022E45F92|nr:exonuclease SbcC [Ligilactobacillus ruminis]